MAESSGSATASGDAGDGKQVLERAVEQAARVLSDVGADDLDRPTPCGDWNVGALAGHLVAAPANFVTMMRGEQPDWSAQPHVADSRATEFRRHADELLDAWRNLDGDPPTPPAMQVSELAVHTWDLATALGRPSSELDPEVAEVALGFMSANLEPEMRGDAFGPEVTPPDGAGPYERLAAFAGRRL